MIDKDLDELFDLLCDGAGAIRDGLKLKPSPSQGSYLIASPRPRLTRDEMQRSGPGDVIDELRRQLDDLPAGPREAVIALIESTASALAAEGEARDPAAPSTLIYALH